MSDNKDREDVIRGFDDLIESLEAAHAARARDGDGRCPRCGSSDVVQSWLDEGDCECRGCGALLHLSMPED